jgi:hypothetical protein
MTMGVQIPVIAGKKKVHDWVVEQLTDLFHTTHRENESQRQELCMSVSVMKD